MNPVALVTGITGQDGSYLAELLLGRGYDVVGVVRRASTINTSRIDHLPGLRLVYGDVTDPLGMAGVLKRFEPSEVYNLAAQSHVAVSFETPTYTAQADALGPLAILEAVRLLGFPCRIYQASTSELFGNAPPPQSELSPMVPESPYAAAKLYAHHIARLYREAHGLWVCTGILFNHESPRRGETFVTRKVTRAVGRILAGTADGVTLGNLDARRDWGHAADYVRAMHAMLQADIPRDYVVATGRSATVRDWCALAFGSAGLDWEQWVRTDPRYVRPAEVHYLQGDASRIGYDLGWTPSVSLEALASEMVEHDIALAKREARS